MRPAKDQHVQQKNPRESCTHRPTEVAIEHIVMARFIIAAKEFDNLTMLVCSGII
jgi:hypothetical protein